MANILKQRIYLHWPDRDAGKLFELDGTQKTVRKADFEKMRREDDVAILITGQPGTVTHYNITLPKPEKV